MYGQGPAGVLRRWIEMCWRGVYGLLQGTWGGGSYGCKKVLHSLTAEGVIQGLWRLGLQCSGSLGLGLGGLRGLGFTENLP